MHLEGFISPMRDYIVTENATERTSRDYVRWKPNVHQRKGFH
ncbi:hypothetical protein Y013_26070 (plasmid) [Rhodococcus pyridinivorans SB3094]|uniref:Uncharacterized protein n=1 Tax=Rhodococcus pyridinivorans SB3094 TaxID=1435356 RepID=V9XPL2_9NOCA|nr:hypothetical protein Y013_26070 [Rhodococcus pyridinivorans SB3094]